MQISKDLRIEVVEKCVHIIEHTELEGDVFIVVAPEEIPILISALQKAYLALCATNTLFEVRK